jgi:hypothetical protein
MSVHYGTAKILEARPSRGAWSKPMPETHAFVKLHLIVANRIECDLCLPNDDLLTEI